MEKKKGSVPFKNRHTRSAQNSPKNNKSELTVVIRPIADLILDDTNPRHHGNDNVPQLAQSIQVFGFNVPILIDANMKVIAGHGRVFAARKLGLAAVPTIKLEHLSDAQAKAYRIADNRLAECSKWDERLLARNLSELSKLDLNFELDVTGFDIGEIDLRIQLLTDDESPRPELDDAAYSITAEAVSRQGDTWVLGEQLAHCGNALDEASYKDLPEKAVMVLADLPYNDPIDGFVSGLGSTHHREFLMASGEMTEPEFTSFLERACRLSAKYSVDGSLHYLFMDWRHLRELTDVGSRVYSGLQNLCVWVKDRPGMGSFYRSRHELVLIFKNGRGPHRNYVRLGKYGRNRTNVWEYPTVRSFLKSGDEGSLLRTHPTAKPTRLLADAMMDASARGELVLDMFLGAGSTLLAAQRTGRRCFGIELDQQYLDVSIRRWQRLTGKRAVHLATGRSFDEIEAEVRHG